MLCSTNSHYGSSRWPCASIGQKLHIFSLIGASWSSLRRKGAWCRCCIFTVADYCECYVCASSNALPLEWQGCFASRYAAFRKCPPHFLCFWKVKELLHLHWWLEETEVFYRLLSTSQITESHRTFGSSAISAAIKSRNYAKAIPSLLAAFLINAFMKVGSLKTFKSGVK